MLVVCTFHFRPPFFTTVVALLDCSHLPTQVAGQQGSYIAHLVNAGYTVGRGGLDQPPPCRVTQAWLGSRSESRSELRSGSRSGSEFGSTDSSHWLDEFVAVLGGGKEKVELEQQVGGRALCVLAFPLKKCPV